ncbi:SDR family NAD(P)-dependent oxidoreductase [Halobacterium litoreum]|uniref:SDR family NAD(P)-dependent oxidoreductase n=1 Tax=Halobacterium litoreum TaxID=2039234 RepID=A0ABD5NI98_9EURY|nr:SDR family NAD(P)-dependent oxidoreductase [Halobacterium litoreum]UHH12208.1 SDR family NAD(P)-dependent oxidoreductase [Halobacterium litoreum]
MVRPEVGASVGHRDCSGETVLVTGATSGVGREVALALARLGADVLVHGRDAARGESVASELRALGSDAAFFRADFADIEAVDELADAVAERADGLDVLVNNAGAHFDEGGLTELGVERTFHVNHLAPFRLTNCLRERGTLDGARVVTVASEVHRRATLDLDAVTSVADYDGFEAYSRSKLANVLFARELARRDDALSSVSCHPGFVPSSGLWRNASLPVRAVMRVFSLVPRQFTFGRVDSAGSAAITPTFLAATGDHEDGAYYKDCKAVDPAPAATDDELAADLWAWSADRASR